MATATKAKPKAPAASKAATKSVTFVSPRIKNTRVVLKPKRIRRSDKGDVLGEEPGIAVAFINHEVTLDDQWANRHADGLGYYDDVDVDWVLEQMRSHELWHQRDGWYEKGFPPGSKLPLPEQLRPQIIEATARGDVDRLAAIREDEAASHARDEILDEVDAALRALSRSASDEGEGQKAKD